MRLPEVPANNRFRILVVEDDAAITKLICVHLKRANFDAFVAMNGLDGWSQFPQVDPHLILTDINMPGLSGHELVERVRATSTVPILMMTAADSDSAQMQGFKVGADDYIPKPFNPQLLMARIIANLRRVYRYDSSAGESALPGATGNEISKPGGLPSGWAKCEACAYMGPFSRFETRDAQGDRVVRCPNCGHKSPTFSLS